ncbi:MAG: YesL family protein [Eubacteriales bacterium]|nr:YesL family protein [Eubacteriales bacterium]
MVKDTPLARVLSKLGDLLVLNLLCLFCALPVITAGASLSALYGVLFRQEREGQAHLVRDFFRAFRQNFLQATALEAMVALIAVFGITDLRYAVAVGGGAGKLYLAVGTVVIFIAMLLQILAICQQAVYHNTVRRFLANSFALAVCAPGLLLLSMAAWVIPWALLATIPEFFFWKLGAAYLMWGLSGPAWATVKLLSGLFQKVQK